MQPFARPAATRAALLAAASLGLALTAGAQRTPAPRPAAPATTSPSPTPAPPARGVRVTEPALEPMLGGFAVTTPLAPMAAEPVLATLFEPHFAPMLPLTPLPASPALFSDVPLTPTMPLALDAPLSGVALARVHDRFDRFDDRNWDAVRTPGSIAGLANTRPRTERGQSGPADSLWRAAREALNRTEYRVAARLFRELRDKYPRSEYVTDSSYWEAFCLYRIGTNEDLRTALGVLRQAQQSSGQYSESKMQADAISLAARIQGALAARGDREAREAINNMASQQGRPCDEEDIAVRVEALSALSQMDEAAALPVLRKVLTRRDPCTVGLRRRAVYLAIRNNADSTASPLLLDVIKNDPDMDVRVEAVEALNRLAGAGGRRAGAALQDVLNTATEERLQNAAARGLAARGDWAALRSFVERSDTPLRLRVAAISGISKERSSDGDVAWLRTLYPKTNEVELKEAIVSTLGRIGGDANEQWLVTLARNPNEPLRARVSAISRLSRSQVPITEFMKIFDSATERQVREYVLRVLMERKEPEAVEKLLDVARTSTDPVLRRTAISYLSRYKNDPRVQKLLLELIDR